MNRKLIFGGLAAIVLLIVFCLVSQKLLSMYVDSEKMDLYCNGISVGMPYEEVMKNLESQGEIRIHEWGTYVMPDTQNERSLVYVYFNSPIKRISLGTIVLEFEDDLLVTFGSTDIGGSWPIPECK